MDPFSAFTGTVGLLHITAQTLLKSQGFASGCREARDDVKSLTRELVDLKSVLEFLQQDTNDSGSNDDLAVPDELKSQVANLIVGCKGVLRQINELFARHSGASLGIQWALHGKQELTALRLSLASYERALGITLDTFSIILSKSIKTDTAAIRTDTSVIRTDVTQIKDTQDEILNRIEELRARPPPSTQSDQGENLILRRYLDSLSNYAETVIGDFPNSQQANDDIEDYYQRPGFWQDSLDPGDRFDHHVDPPSEEQPRLPVPISNSARLSASRSTNSIGGSTLSYDVDTSREAVYGRRSAPESRLSLHSGAAAGGRTGEMGTGSRFIARKPVRRDRELCSDFGDSSTLDGHQQQHQHQQQRNSLASPAERLQQQWDSASYFPNGGEISRERLQQQPSFKLFLRRTELWRGRRPFSISPSPQGRFLAITYSKEVDVIDLETTGAQPALLTLPSPGFFTKRADERHTRAVIISEARPLALVRCTGGQLLLYNYANGTQLGRIAAVADENEREGPWKNRWSVSAAAAGEDQVAVVLREQKSRQLQSFRIQYYREGGGDSAVDWKRTYCGAEDRPEVGSFGLTSSPQRTGGPPSIVCGLGGPAGQARLGFIDVEDGTERKMIMTAFKTEGYSYEVLDLLEHKGRMVSVWQLQPPSHLKPKKKKKNKAKQSDKDKNEKGGGTKKKKKPNRKNFRLSGQYKLAITDVSTNCSRLTDLPDMRGGYVKDGEDDEDDDDATPFAMCISPDLGHLALWDPMGLRIFEIADAEDPNLAFLRPADEAALPGELHTAEDGDDYCGNQGRAADLCFSADGRRLYLLGASKIMVYDIKAQPCGESGVLRAKRSGYLL